MEFNSGFKGLKSDWLTNSVHYVLVNKQLHEVIPKLMCDITDCDKLQSVSILKTTESQKN